SAEKLANRGPHVCSVHAPWSVKPCTPVAVVHSARVVTDNGLVGRVREAADDGPTDRPVLQHPTRGAVIVDGVDATRLSDGARADIRGRRIGFVFQEYNLLPSLDVVENVMLPLRYTGVATRDGRTRARQLLDLVGLSDRLHHRPD